MTEPREFERWAEMPEYEGLYEVSSKLRVRSVDRVVNHPKSGFLTLKGQLMATYTNASGQVCVKLCKEGKTRIVYVERKAIEAGLIDAKTPPAEPGEEWRETEFRGYLASSFGRIWSVPRYVKGGHSGLSQLRRGGLLSPGMDKAGYLYVNIAGTTRFVHRLVARAFLPIPPNPTKRNTVNHKDHNRANNRIENLEWATQRENVLHGKHTRHSDMAVIKQVMELWMSGMDAHKIAQELKLSRKTVLALTKNWAEPS